MLQRKNRIFRIKDDTLKFVMSIILVNILIADSFLFSNVEQISIIGVFKLVLEFSVLRRVSSR